MRMNTRLASAAVAVALAASIGMAATPVQAKNTTSVTGSTRLAVLPSVVTSMSVVGVQVNAESPATSEWDAAGDQTLAFPMSRPAVRSMLPLDGGISIGASLARLWLTAPRLESSTVAGASQGRITFEVANMPADGPAGLANGKRITLFTVSPMTVSTKKGRVTKVGKTWTRTDTQRITGNLSLVDDAALLTSINTFIGTEFFQPAMPFGSLATVVTTKVTCPTSKACG